MSEKSTFRQPALDALARQGIRQDALRAAGDPGGEHDCISDHAVLRSIWGIPTRSSAVSFPTLLLCASALGQSCKTFTIAGGAPTAFPLQGVHGVPPSESN